MRKVLLLNVLALTMFSCAVEESASNPTTSISAIVTPEAKTSSLTGKDVKRGNIYPWVKDITLTVSSNETSHVASEVYTLVPNSTSGSAADAGVFRLDNVAIGSNTISAVSTTSTIGDMSLTVSRGVPATVVTESIARNPYAIYHSPIITKDIQETPNNVISIPMNTNNGRIIGAFSVNDAYLLRNFEVWVSATVNNVEVNKVRIQAGDVAKFYYSDATAVAGAVVKYTVTTVNIKTQTVFEVVTESVTMEASTSYSCNYLVMPKRKLFKDENKFNFVFQPWKETTCPTCPGN
jgi:hypothetical protein